MSKLYLMCGGIAQGKSTWVKNNIQDLPNDTITISGDHLRKMLIPGKYTFNYKYEDIIWTAIFSMAKGFMDSYIDVIIDACNISKKRRKEWITLAKEYGYEVVVVTFPKISMKETIKRRMADNHGDTPSYVWKEVYETFTKNYQEPSLDEGVTEIIKGST